jgi:hypothetical protein
MGWLITLGILTLLAVLPLGVSVRYDEGGAVVRVIAGPVRITLFPRPKKDKKPKKEKKSKEKSATEPAKQPAEQPEAAPATASKAEPVKTEPKEKPKASGGSITDFLPLVQIALDMLGAFRRRLRLNRLELKLIMAADDPCDLAVNYGRAWAAVGNLMPRLERVFVIQKRNIEVECDFEATQTKIIARLDLTITLGRILATAVVYGVKALVEFLKIKNKRKGGATQ